MDNGHKIVKQIMKDVPKDMSEITQTKYVDDDSPDDDDDFFVDTELFQTQETVVDKVSEVIHDKVEAPAIVENDPLESQSSIETQILQDESFANMLQADLIIQDESKDIEIEESHEEYLNKYSKWVDESISTIKNFIKREGVSLIEINDEISKVCGSIWARPDIKHFIIFNSLFSVNILYEFKKYLPILKLYFESGSEGATKYFLMAMCNFFITQHPNIKKAIDTFMVYLYESELIDAETLLQWSANKFKTDKKSVVYCRTEEKEFKNCAKKFFEWLSKDDSDSDSSDEEEQQPVLKESIAQEHDKTLKMKQMIEDEIKAQEEHLMSMKQQNIESIFKLIGQ